MGKRRTGSQVILKLLVGIMCGFFLGPWSQNLMLSSCQTDSQIRVLHKARGPRSFGADNSIHHDSVKSIVNSSSSNVYFVPSHSPSKRLILVGVMTARKYLTTRVVSAYETWAKSIPGHVIFFSSAGSELAAPPGIPVIGLRGVDDTYPPQKKSFLMLKYMYDNFADKYEWFMRVDDDVYVKGDKLASFLHSINSSVPHFLGQAGLGTKQEFGQLNLKKNENFCMGGSGMVFSQATLRKVAPNVSYCLKNLYTTHEDVEIGRCVQKFAGISCSWAFEVSTTGYLFLDTV